MRARLVALGVRWPWFGAVLAVQKRVDELGGGFVAGAVTLSLFLSLFPLLLVATAVLGFVSSGDAGFAADVVDTLGLSGAAAETVTEALASAEEQRATASIVGFVGALWSALGVVGAVGHAALYGSIGVVLAILAWLFFFGRLLVYRAALNVVRYERRFGTVRVEVVAPRLPGEVALEANRSAVVVTRDEPT